MGRKKRPWQDVDYVLRYFGKPLNSARKAYFSHVETGLDQGRRDDLTGGGLIRSLGGWSEVKRLQLKGQNHIKSDERILGEMDFVDSVLSQAGEKYDRQHELKHRGYDLNRIAKRVAVICEMAQMTSFQKVSSKRKPRPGVFFAFGPSENWASRSQNWPGIWGLVKVNKKKGNPER